MKFALGFTLVELLIVIAIIGVLVSVVLGSLRDARDDGLDSKVKSEMVSLAKKASVVESQSFSYDAVCGSNSVTQSPGIVDIITSVELFSVGSVVCNSDTAQFAASVPLNSSFWCVDNIGASKETLRDLNPGELVCP